MAKKSDIIPTMHKNLFDKILEKLNLKKAELIDENKIDTRKFIDIDDVKSVAKKLEKLNNQYTNSNESLDDFLNIVKSLKRKAVRRNIGSCILALGVIAPAIMVAIRKFGNNNEEFQTKKDIEAKLANQN